MTISRLILVIGVVFGLLVSVHCCSEPTGPRTKTTNVWWALQNSPVVLKGNYLDDNAINNTVTLFVGCIFKNGGLDLPLKITLLGAEQPTSCGMHIEKGKEYIIGLRAAVADRNDTFLINKPGPIMDSIAVDGNRDNERTAANLCGFGKVTYAQGYFDCPDQISAKIYVCPDRTATRKTCFQPAQYNGQYPYSLSLLLLAYSLSLHLLG